MEALRVNAGDKEWGHKILLFNGAIGQYKLKKEVVDDISIRISR